MPLPVASRSASAKCSIIRLLRIDHYPTPSNQSKPVGLAEQFVDLGLCEFFAIEGYFQAEIEKRSLPQSRWRLATDGGCHLRAAGDGWLATSRASAPRPRRSPVAARLSEAAWPGPASTAMVEKFSRVDHGLQPGTALGRPLHGKKQREQALLVCGPLHIRAEPGPGEDAALCRAPPAASCRWRNANGAASSLRFSARLKWTRPTRFQAGLRRFSNSSTLHFDSDNSTRKAVSCSCQKAPKTGAV
jgi:hypothetical protein